MEAFSGERTSASGIQQAADALIPACGVFCGSVWPDSSVRDHVPVTFCWNYYNAFDVHNFVSLLAGLGWLDCQLSFVGEKYVTVAFCVCVWSCVRTGSVCTAWLRVRCICYKLFGH